MTVPAADNLRRRAAYPFALAADAEVMEAAADLFDAIDALVGDYIRWFDAMPETWTPMPGVLGHVAACRDVYRLLHPEEEA